MSPNNKSSESTPNKNEHTSSKKLNGTTLVHGDEEFAGPDVAPSIAVSSTYRSAYPPRAYDAPGQGIEILNLRNPERHVYSRYTQPVSTRAEHIIGKISDGFAITYASGIAASYSALVFYRPKRVALRGGYFGCHAAMELYGRTHGNPLQLVDLDTEYQPGDLCWLETPVNPFGEARDIQYYADKIHKVGGKLLVDSTFGPPPLQYPFRHGADCILHSGSKYLGGHADLLAGVLIVKTEEDWNQLFHGRTFMGNMMGSLESWLLLRSLRTLHLRVPRQSENATVIAEWLDAVSKTPKGQTYDGAPGAIVKKVFHTSLQGVDERGFDPSKQMQGGWSPTFSIMLEDPKHALHFPHLLTTFVAATSLGSVESLVEHRYQSDATSDRRLIRLSIGIEDVEDLKDDLRQALLKLKAGNFTKAKL